MKAHSDFAHPRPALVPPTCRSHIEQWLALSSRLGRSSLSTRDASTSHTGNSDGCGYDEPPLQDTLLAILVEAGCQSLLERRLVRRLAGPIALPISRLLSNRGNRHARCRPATGLQASGRFLLLRYAPCNLLSGHGVRFWKRRKRTRRGDVQRLSTGDRELPLLR